MKWCSASRIMSEMQIGTTKSYHPLGWLLSKRQKITSISEDVEKMEHLYTVDGRVNWRVIVETTQIPQKFKNRTTILFSNLTSGNIYQGNKISILRIYLHYHLYCSIIHHSPDVEPKYFVN